MKIALLGPSYPFRGGIAHYTTLLFRALKKRHEVEFLSFKRQYPAFLSPFKSDRDISLKPIQEKGCRPVLDSMNPLSWIRTASTIVRFEPDLAIIPWWVSFWAPHFLTITLHVKLRSDAKILFLCHNVIEHESGILKRTFSRSVLKRGNFFVVQSETDHKNLVALIPGVRIKKNYLPSLDPLDFEPVEKEEARKALGVDGHVLLFFGFIRRYKGLLNLLRAMPAITAELDNVALLIAGEFWEDKETYLEIIKDLNLQEKIKIVDRYVANEEVGSFFSAADLVVLPYISATGSAVVQLSYAFSKPVVASSAGALAEVVTDGETGYLVEPGNPEAIARAVIRFFKEKRSSVFAANIANGLDKFSWERLVETIESFFEEPLV
ncbi:glycosyltransferase [Acidobacteriota bacterium]